MSTCPRCYDDTGCTCKEHDRIKDLEAENVRYKATLARCSKICSQTGLMPPNGQWARMQVISTVEEALKEGV